MNIQNPNFFFCFYFGHKNVLKSYLLKGNKVKEKEYVSSHPGNGENKENPKI